MFLTETEIMQQHLALEKTYNYVMEMRECIQNFFRQNPMRRFVFLGCGSSYMLAKSAQRMLMTYPDTWACAIAGGDYLVNPETYDEIMKDSIVVTLSRSGKTTEMVRDVEYMKKKFNSPIISLSMLDDNDIMPYSDLNLTMDWCYDQSVCQTRTVTNLYAAVLMLAAIYGEDEELLAAVKEAVDHNEEYKVQYRPLLEKIAALDWDNAVILADGVPEGIAEEGALAFTEIAMLTGKYFHLLDYRHGPMVLNGPKTLTIALLQPGNRELQETMIHDLKKKGGYLITVSEEEGNPYEVQQHICLKNISRYEAWGIPFIYVTQMTAYSKAILLKLNPDEPSGLDAYITL